MVLVGYLVRIKCRRELNVGDNQLYGKGEKKCFLIEMKTSVMTMGWSVKTASQFCNGKGEFIQVFHE